jgi:hypothetical protein
MLETVKMVLLEHQRGAQRCARAIITDKKSM